MRICRRENWTDRQASVDGCAVGRGRPVTSGRPYSSCRSVIGCLMTSSSTEEDTERGRSFPGVGHHRLDADLERHMRAPRSLKTFTDRYPYLGPGIWILAIEYFIVQFV